MEVHLRELAARQYDLVATWQLMAAGWSRKRVRHHSARGGWRRIHRGVYALTQAALTRHQVWMAATLIAPGSFLSHGSGGACFGFRPFQGRLQAVTRSGNHERRRHDGLVVFHSTTLKGDTTVRQGIPITTAARVLIDIAPGLKDSAIGKAHREALRLKTTTTGLILVTLDRHRGRAGTPPLRELATRYRKIPYARTRSDAEALALELLHDAGLPPPLVNAMIAGEEADLAWPKRRLIIEIDGPQFHQFPEEDARKAEIWRNAGFTVRRIASDAVFDQPASLIELATRG